MSSRTPTKVIVVGAGMVGLSTAWFLQRAGAEVTVVERGKIGSGASKGNAGWITPALTLPLTNPSMLRAGILAAMSPKSPVYIPPAFNPRLWEFLARFAVNSRHSKWLKAAQHFVAWNKRAFEAYDAITQRDELNTQSFPMHSAPLTVAFSSPGSLSHLLEELEVVAQLGGEVEYEILSKSELNQAQPIVSENAVQGLSITNQRFIDPYRFLTALARSLQSQGGRLLEYNEALEVLSHARMAEVRLQDQTLEAEAVVLATGSSLSRLARGFGVRRYVQSGRGYSFTVSPEQLPDSPIYFPEQRLACTPISSGLRLAGMMEFRPDEAPLDRRRISAIVSAAGSMLRGIDWSSRSDEWVGSRPCTSDGIPLVGRSRAANIFIAGGHGMWGIALGPLSGQLISEQIMTGETPDLLRQFDPLR